MKILSPVPKCYLLLTIFIFCCCIFSTTCLNMWTSLEEHQANKTPVKRCVSPCKIFHSWCKNDGKCREKGKDCTWFCECPDNCEGFFCEKILSKDSPASETTNQKVEVIVTYEKEKKKDLTAFDTSKLTQALLGIHKKTQTDEEKKTVVPETIDRSENEIETKENVTAKIILNCPPEDLLPKLPDNTTEDAGQTPANKSDCHCPTNATSAPSVNASTTIEVNEINNGSATEANTTSILASSLNKTLSTKSPQAVTPIVGSSAFEDILNTDAYTSTNDSTFDNLNDTVTTDSPPHNQTTLPDSNKSYPKTEVQEQIHISSEINKPFRGPVPENSLFRIKNNTVKEEITPELSQIIEKAIEVQLISTTPPTLNTTSTTVQTAREIVTNLPTSESVLDLSRKELGNQSKELMQETSPPLFTTNIKSVALENRATLEIVSSSATTEKNNDAQQLTQMSTNNYTLTTTKPLDFKVQPQTVESHTRFSDNNNKNNQSSLLSEFNNNQPQSKSLEGKEASLTTATPNITTILISYKSTTQSSAAYDIQSTEKMQDNISTMSTFFSTSKISTPVSQQINNNNVLEARDGSGQSTLTAATTTTTTVINIINQTSDNIAYQLSTDLPYNKTGSNDHNITTDEIQSLTSTSIPTLTVTGASIISHDVPSTTGLLSWKIQTSEPVINTGHYDSSATEIALEMSTLSTIQTSSPDTTSILPVVSTKKQTSKIRPQFTTTTSGISEANTTIDLTQSTQRIQSNSTMPASATTTSFSSGSRQSEVPETLTKDVASNKLQIPLNATVNMNDTETILETLNTAQQNLTDTLTFNSMNISEANYKPIHNYSLDIFGTLLNNETDSKVTNISQNDFTTTKSVTISSRFMLKTSSLENAHQATTKNVNIDAVNVNTIPNGYNLLKHADLTDTVQETMTHTLNSDSTSVKSNLLEPERLASQSSTTTATGVTSLSTENNMATKPETVEHNIDKKSELTSIYTNKEELLTNILPESVKKDLKFDLLKMELALREKGLPSDIDNVI